MENQKNNQFVTAGEKQIISLLRKQNAILADIYREIKKDNHNDIMLNSTDIPAEKTAIELLPNERVLEVCHVIKNNMKYTYSKGKCIEVKPATPTDCYMYRNID